MLDPEQNGTFTDHYLEIPYDLSNVMFVATANVIDTIPAPLRDRMEIIEIASYTRREKLAIARRHLLPKQLREHGVSADKVDITDEALTLLIEGYTREAGVRALEKAIASVVRGIVVRFAELGEVPTVVRTADDLRGISRTRPPRRDRRTHRDDRRGDRPCLDAGRGHILFVEATRMPGRASLPSPASWATS